MILIWWFKIPCRMGRHRRKILFRLSIDTTRTSEQALRAGASSCEAVGRLAWGHGAPPVASWEVLREAPQPLEASWLRGASQGLAQDASWLPARPRSCRRPGARRCGHRQSHVGPCAVFGLHLIGATWNFKLWFTVINLNPKKNHAIMLALLDNSSIPPKLPGRLSDFAIHSLKRLPSHKAKWLLD